MRSWGLAALLLMAAAGEASAADCSHPAPVQVAADTGSVTIASGPPTATNDCYQIAMDAGQNLILKLEGANGDAVLVVYGPGWTATCNPTGDCEFSGDQMSEENASEWAETLEAGGTYLIVVDNSRSDSEYRLTVEIEE